MTTYLCYDIKGIQSFIFQIPRLRYAVGGSVLIDDFDRRFAGNELRVNGARLIFSGGGRGAFECDSDAIAEEVERLLVEKAREIGAGIAFGMNADYSEAAHSADRLHPYRPPGDLAGEPCKESGLYPVRNHDEHEVVRARRIVDGNKILRQFEEMFSARIERPLTWGGLGFEFFHDVSPDPDEESPIARAAARSLGSRNRWAVIVMDGNDMGVQFRSETESPMKPEEHREWLKESSVKLDDSTRAACCKGIQRVIDEWRRVPEIVEAATFEGCVILPIRPLIVGGDDIIVLCHAAHAFDFVRTVAEDFAASALRANENYRQSAKRALWPATGGRLTISAGVLFAPVSLPFATAVEYAESLLASAKSKGRNLKRTGEPAPACIDWDSVTASVLEHPATARQRESRFLDQDLGEIVTLTRRPYTIDDLAVLQDRANDYGKVPHSILQQAASALRAGYWDRQVWRARLLKHQPELARDLEEPKEWKGPHGRWIREERDHECERTTDVLDALDLLIEKHRMQRDTLEASR